MRPVTHFEIPFNDKEKARKFYEEVFDWKFQDMPDMNYTMVYTCEVDDKFMCKETNRINGGMYKRDEHGSKTPVIVIDVENTERYVKKVQEAGGSIVMPVRQVGDFGIYAQVKDTEGNIIGIWQSLPKHEEK